MLGCSEMQGKAIGNGLTPKGSNMFAPHRTFQNNFLTPKWKLTCTRIVNDKMDRFSYWYEYVKIHTKIEIRWINVGKTMTEYYLWTRLFFVTSDSETTSYLTLDRETQMTSQEGRSSAFTQQKHIMIYPFTSVLDILLKIFIENKYWTNCRIQTLQFYFLEIINSLSSYDLLMNKTVCYRTSSSEMIYGQNGN